MRKEEIERKKKMLEELMKGKKAEKVKQKAEETEVNADVNNDGVIDEQDVEIVKKKVKKKKAEQAE